MPVLATCASGDRPRPAPTRLFPASGRTTRPAAGTGRAATGQASDAASASTLPRQRSGDRADRPAAGNAGQAVREPPPEPTRPPSIQRAASSSRYATDGTQQPLYGHTAQAATTSISPTNN